MLSGKNCPGRFGSGNVSSHWSKPGLNVPLTGVVSAGSISNALSSNVQVKLVIRLLPGREASGPGPENNSTGVPTGESMAAPMSSEKVWLTPNIVNWIFVIVPVKPEASIVEGYGSATFLSLMSMDCPPLVNVMRSANVVRDNIEARINVATARHLKLMAKSLIQQCYAVGSTRRRKDRSSQSFAFRESFNYTKQPANGVLWKCDSRYKLIFAWSIKL